LFVRADWFQNVRHSYWYALLAGDTDLMRPLYQMYMKQLPVMRERSRQWYGHNGTRFAETSFFYGAFEPVDYGCQRKPTDPPDPVSAYIKNHIQGGVELATMLLHNYQHTGNATLLSEVVLPWCESLLEFYDEHFPKTDDGQLFLQHAQSCETWPDCDNPAAQVAALMRIAEGLRAVPHQLLTTKQSAFFSRIAKALPSIPLTSAQNGLPQISPCDGGFPSKHVNGENVETYVIWPYEIHFTH
jgi:alpha-L-fucosidase 2